MEGKNYKLIYEQVLSKELDYSMTEEEYLSYYQNECDPTFEKYDFMKFKFVNSDIVSYLETGINILREGKKLSILTWRDFINFINEWALANGWNFTHTNFSKNNGIKMVTTKSFDDIGEIKCYG
jgi:hypothetical protein